jgi:hypothetical protein
MRAKEGLKGHFRVALLSRILGAIPFPDSPSSVIKKTYVGDYWMHYRVYPPKPWAMDQPKINPMEV